MLSVGIKGFVGILNNYTCWKLKIILTASWFWLLAAWYRGHNARLWMCLTQWGSPMLYWGWSRGVTVSIDGSNISVCLLPLSSCIFSWGQVVEGGRFFFIFIHGFEKPRNLYKYLKNAKSYRMDWEERLLVHFLNIYLFYFLLAIMVNGRDDFQVFNFISWRGFFCACLFLTACLFLVRIELFFK